MVPTEDVVLHRASDNETGWKIDVGMIEGIRTKLSRAPEVCRLQSRETRRRGDVYFRSGDFHHVVGQFVKSGS